MKRFFALILAAVMLLGVSAAASAKTALYTGKKSLTISKTTLISLNAKNVASLSAEYTNAACLDLKWGKAKNNVIKLYVIPKKEGECNVTVKNSDTGEKVTVGFTVKFIKAKSISLNHKSFSIQKGKSLRLKATVLPKNTKNTTVKWGSTNSKIVSVDKNGKITARKTGSAKIVAKTCDGSKLRAVCAVKVVK